METGQVAPQTDAEFKADLDAADSEWSDRVNLSRKQWREFRQAAIYDQRNVDSGAALVSALREFLNLCDLPVETEDQAPIVPIAPVRAKRTVDPIEREARRRAAYAALAHGKR
jgi:hypothetical protein